jgi:hypothetical protein
MCSGSRVPKRAVSRSPYGRTRKDLPSRKEYILAVKKLSIKELERVGVRPATSTRLRHKPRLDRFRKPPRHRAFEDEVLKVNTRPGEKIRVHVMIKETLKILFCHCGNSDEAIPDYLILRNRITSRFARNDNLKFFSLLTKRRFSV